MQQSQKIWRSFQIAAQLLYRYFGDIEIENADNSICDLFVTLPDGIKFGVEVKFSTYTKSEGFRQSVQHLVNIDYNKPANRIPIVLLCINELSESATFGVLLGWRFGRPQIFDNFEMRQLNENNAHICETLIRLMSEVVTFVSTSDWQVLKRIPIEQEIAHGRIQHGEILYLRRFSDKYRINTPQVVNEKVKFKRLLEGIPQDEYPNDDLDYIIERAVQKQYPTAKLSNTLLLSSVDFKDLQTYRDYHRSIVHVCAFPDYGELKFSPNQFGNELIEPIPLEIYTAKFFCPEVFDGLSFDLTVSFKEWINITSDIKSLLPTLGHVNKYLI